MSMLIFSRNVIYITAKTPSPCLGNGRVLTITLKGKRRGRKRYGVLNVNLTLLPWTDQKNKP
jgi:hypothetical protein